MDEDVGGDEVYQHQVQTSPVQQEQQLGEAGGSGEGEQSQGQSQSTSSLTVKLNKLNCESSGGSEEPRPGPSNSAADFDLEVRLLVLLVASSPLCEQCTIIVLRYKGVRLRVQLLQRGMLGVGQRRQQSQNHLSSRFSSYLFIFFSNYKYTNFSYVRKGRLDKMQFGLHYQEC